jgi:hypothetical protein
MLGSARAAEPVRDSLLEVYKSTRLYVIRMDTSLCYPMQRDSCWSCVFRKRCDLGLRADKVNGRNNGSGPR